MIVFLVRGAVQRTILLPTLLPIFRMFCFKFMIFVLIPIQFTISVGSYFTVLFFIKKEWRILCFPPLCLYSIFSAHQHAAVKQQLIELFEFLLHSHQHFWQASYPSAIASDLVTCLALDGFILPQSFLL